MRARTVRVAGLAAALLFAGTVTGSARALTSGVCYCCKTSLAIADGSVYAVWRHVYPGNMRDIAFTVSRDGGGGEGGVLAGHSGRGGMRGAERRASPDNHRSPWARAALACLRREIGHPRANRSRTGR